MKLLSILLAIPLCIEAEHGYLGRDVCAGCHKDIAATQLQTRMAQTWQGESTRQLPSNYEQGHAEGPDPAIQYEVQRNAKGFVYSVHLPGRVPSSYAVEDITGGTRHGLSFLLRVNEIEGLSLTRAPLVEGRYLYSQPLHGLALSPGFPSEQPTGYDTAIGRVLSPGFEKKCLTCHGQTQHVGTASGSGVTCESCHGAGQPHLAALGKKSEDKGILNPKKLPVAEQMRPCSQCHAGFSKIQDPMPDDLLISDQVTALQNSECWRQAAGQITCVNCHTPHQDAPRQMLETRSEKTCLGCHMARVSQHAALCPVNRSSGCVGCHMPDTKDRPPFQIADHWIRVHPEQNVSAPRASPEWRSQVTPKRLFLRAIVLEDAAKATAISQQLAGGTSFFELARANSVDRESAVNGGFLGDLEAGQLNPAWSSAALRLRPGEISGVVEGQGRFYILQRMARNFREDAETHFNRAMDSRKQGDRQKSAAELLEALRIYPRLLRALTYLGVTFAEGGDPRTASGILNAATRLYPEDAGAHFNLGIAYGAMGSDDQIKEYKRALEIDPDLVPVYLNLGAALYNKGQIDEAIQIYRQGIEVNPLIASLHYSLSVALQQRVKSDEAEKEMAVANKINPALASK